MDQKTLQDGSICSRANLRYLPKFRGLGDGRSTVTLQATFPMPQFHRDCSEYFKVISFGKNTIYRTGSKPSTQLYQSFPTST